MKTIKISKEYSDTPLGRFEGDGPFNGTRFREEFLRPAISTEDKVVVDIDDVEGYGSSFLEEAFGGLIRKGYFTLADVEKKLSLLYRNRDYKVYHDLIWRYLREAKAEPKN